MSSESVEIRANFTTKEFTVIGTETVAKFWTERFIDLFSLKAVEIADSAVELDEKPKTTNSKTVLPEIFGEYLNRFKSGITDVDRSLIAAYFAQSRSTDNAFARGDMNELLLAQGVRLANPSVAIQRNVSARRIFAIGGGRFRVSKTGTQYLVELETKEN